VRKTGGERAGCKGKVRRKVVVVEKTPDKARKGKRSASQKERRDAKAEMVTGGVTT